MFCKNCGRELPKNVKFCPNCGVSLISGAGTKNVWQKITDVFSGIKFKIPKINKWVILSIIILVALSSGVLAYYKGWISLPSLSDDYIFNPKMKDTPIESVVRIVVNQGTDKEASGSGLLFTKDGYILTNAHVVTTSLGKGEKNIKVCYSTKNNETKCEYDAKFVDASESEDLAIIKVDREIREIKPYLLVVRGDDESGAKKTLPIGGEIKAVGFPGVGGNTVTVTKGIVAGYTNTEIGFDDGSIQIIPHYIKTDTEINFGNSGGAIFDQKNRFIGVPTVINKDDGGKIGYIIYWNNINIYLNQLVYGGVLSLSDKQYKERHYPSSENDLWDGIKSYFKEDYNLAKEKLENYTKNKPNDSRGWHYLCGTYLDNNETEKLEKCAEQLRSSNDQAAALSWLTTSYYNSEIEGDNNKAYESIMKAVALAPDSKTILDIETYYEIILGKIDDADKTNKKSMDIDPYESFVWYLKGLIENERENYSEGITYIEYSFSLEPDAETASWLSDVYWESEEPEELLKSLEYGVAALILDQNVSDVFSVSNKIFQIFNADTESSWSESLDGMRQILDTLEVDRSLLDPIANVSDDKITDFIKESGENKKNDQETVDGVRFYVKTIVSWLYSFLGDKTMCQYDYADKKVSDINNILNKLEITDKSDQNAFLQRYVLMECLCELDNYSNESVGGCYNKKSQTICGENKILTSDMGCLTGDQACKKTYGGNAYMGGDGMCACASGYEWNSNQTSCIKSCPVRTHYSGGKCVCDTGYISSGGSCLLPSETCSSREYYSDGSCHCNSSYPVFRNGSCITHTEHCSLDWGGNLYGTSDGKGGTNCYCNSGYVWNIDNSACASKASIDAICRRDVGAGSYYLGYVENGKYMCSSNN